MKSEISEAEMEIMEILWKEAREITSAQITEYLPNTCQWKPTTILTLCKRLEEKGYVKRRKEGKINYYSNTITRQEYKASQTQSFLKTVHKGSVKSFMAALYDGDGLTHEEIDELKQWLKEV